MKTKVIKTIKGTLKTAQLKEIADVLKNGGIVIMPTDTVYAVAANAFCHKSCLEIYRLKGRHYRKPLVIMPQSSLELGKIAHLNEKTKKIVSKFWPGPLTLILKTNHLGKILMGGRDNLGARIPKSSLLKALMKYCTFPLATTSANPSVKPSAKNAQEAIKYFDGKVAVIIDGGPCQIGKESTVIDVSGFPFVVVRKGCLDSKKLLPYM